ncbi:hypothetical protein NDA16_004026 [Ustilago loliicola]|nr:hypothetical protein NDA16_004026 [Ustilago loliicola]
MQAVAVSCSPSFAQIFDTQTPVAPDTSSADEPMLASPIASSAEASTMSIMDVERTPTKRNARAQPNGKLIASYIQPRSHAAADDDQEPRSTPTIGATSPRPDDDHAASQTSPPSTSSAYLSNSEKDDT